jgi:hypothetical protein
VVRKQHAQLVEVRTDSQVAMASPEQGHDLAVIEVLKIIDLS